MGLVQRGYKKHNSLSDYCTFGCLVILIATPSSAVDRNTPDLSLGVYFNYI